MLKKHWNETRDRYSAFWGGQPIDRPPVMFDTVGEYKNPMYNLAGYDYTKYGENIEKFRTDYRDVWEKRFECPDDAVPCISPQYGGAFEASLFAGDIIWGNEITRLSPHNPAENVKSLDILKFDKENPYFKRLLHDMAHLTRYSNGEYGVSYDGGMSVTTTISQLLGGTRFMYALYDDSEGVRALAERITDTLIHIQAQIDSLTARPDGGSCHRWLNYWNPGKGFWFSEDDAILMSPEMYRDIFLDLNIRMCASADFAALHWHDGGLHLIPELLKIENLKMIQLSPDPHGPSFEKLLEVCKNIIEHNVKICFQMNYEQEKINKIFKSLPANSCMFCIGYADSIENAEHILSEIEAAARKK